jgi:hypothetical protein
MAVLKTKKELDAYLPLLSNRQQEILLDVVKNLLHIDKKEKHISMDQYNEELDIAIKQVQQGRFITHKQMAIESKKWLKRK